MSIVYTCNTYFVMHSGPCNLFGSIWSMFSYNILYWIRTFIQLSLLFISRPGLIFLL